MFIIILKANLCCCLIFFLTNSDARWCVRCEVDTNNDYFTPRNRTDILPSVICPWTNYRPVYTQKTYSESNHYSDDDELKLYALLDTVSTNTTLTLSNFFFVLLRRIINRHHIFIIYVTALKWDFPPWWLFLWQLFNLKRKKKKNIRRNWGAFVRANMSRGLHDNLRSRSKSIIQQ